MRAGRGKYDLLVVGGGMNGAGVARDAAGRGLRTAALRAARPRRPHLVRQHQADPRRTALPRVLRLPAGAQVAARAGDRPRVRAAHRAADALRPAARRAPAAGVDDPRGTLPLRSPRAAPAPAGLRGRGPAPSPGRRAARPALHEGLRVLGRLGGRRAPRGAHRDGRPRARRDDPHAHPLLEARAQGRSLVGDARPRGRRRGDGSRRAPS